jgi:hypothetical protein
MENDENLNVTSFTLGGTRQPKMTREHANMLSGLVSTSANFCEAKTLVLGWAQQQGTFGLHQ